MIKISIKNFGIFPYIMSEMPLWGQDFPLQLKIM